MIVNVYRLVALAVLISAINAQCDYTSPGGDYKASWYLDSAAQIVHFKLSSAQKLPGGYWTGIGFGGKMQGGDMIIISSINNQVTVSDRQGLGYSEPIEDGQQDVKDFKGRLENGVIQAEFARAVDTKDAQDIPIIDKTKNNCQDFIFPVSGGSASPSGIQKHSNTPVVQKICNIDKCPQFSGAAAGATDAATTGAGGAVTTGHPLATSTLSAIVTGEFGTTGSPKEPSGSPATGIGGPASTSVGGPAPTSTGQGTIGTGGATGTGFGKQSCSYTEGEYTASWAYEPASQSVRFSLSAPLSLNKWTGIGFGQTMQGGDMIIIHDANGVVNISDRHGVGHVEPLVDAHSDVTGFQNTYDGKKIQAQFSRAINTRDPEDLALQDPANNNCQYFIFPVSGGTIVNNRDGKPMMGIHSETPKPKLICGITECTGGATGGAIATPAPSVGGETSNQPTQTGVTRGTGFPPAGGVTTGQQRKRCPRRDDHSACKNYVDDYLTVVYTKFPRTDQITTKACGLLESHQNGIVYTECCHYLWENQICGRLWSADLGGEQPPPETSQPIVPSQQPQPQSPQQPQPQQPVQIQPQAQPSGGNVQLQQPQNRNPLPGRPNLG